MIRVITSGDIEPFYFLVHHNRDRLQTYFPMTVFHTQTILQTRKFVLEKIKEAQNQEFLLMLIHNEQGQLIGMMHAKHFDRYVRKCEISYFVDKNHVNKGYATRAIKEIINYIFSRTDMEKIYCRIDPENLASIRVAEKVGFVKEGHLRNEFRTGDDRIIDILYFGIIKQKYQLQVW
jgi:ribosomal-protein-serine acetyltransferase